ncbi:ProQ/FinO family protein [Methylomonas sp. LL1]|uniref:ProQ/FinO family protein n=1 Tax=Methylomonas sp. LL1 TaxID=2785785 RepID=UPI0018C394EE|nr:ProQ/FinO family protein [Methylomonas sp. LL1]QPK62556.1 ProQ/FinO family protein [Methylomonas sp. LL1]
MGFEQLASLKDELAKQAAAKKEAQKQKRESENIKKPQVDPVLRTIGLLQKHFPLAFPKKPLPKVPLKIGIHKDLLEHAKALGLTPNDIRAAMKKWVKGKRYSECMIEGAARIDLQGKEAGFVSKDEAVQGNKTTEDQLAHV